MTDIAKIESNVFFFSHAAFSLISMMFLFFIPYFCAWNWIAECFREVRSWTWEQCSRLSQRLRRHSQPSTTADYWSTYWDSTPGRRGETSSMYKKTVKMWYFFLLSFENYTNIHVNMIIYALLYQSVMSISVRRMTSNKVQRFLLYHY